MAELRRVLLSAIADTPCRAGEGESFEQLRTSIRERGILQPPMVTPDGNGNFLPVLGRRRIAAARSLGLEAIECQVADLDELERKLAEIDENTCRRDYTSAELSAVMLEKSKLYEAVHGHPKGRGASAANAAMGRSASDKLAPAFSKAMADASGVSARTVQRSVSRAQILGSDALERIKGTSLDRGVEIDALASLPTGERGPLIERAASGEGVSAVAVVAEKSCCKPRTKRTSPASTDDLGRLQRAWGRAAREVRLRFLDWLRTEDPAFLASDADPPATSAPRKAARASSKATRMRLS